MGKGDMLKVHNKMWPMIYLDKFFNVKSHVDDIENTTACLVKSDLKNGCFIVDAIVGQQQVVIKSLSERLKNVKGFSGATILGDGHVGLILDVSSIFEVAHEEP